MATFTFGRAIDIHWNGYDIQGPAGTVFSIPDQLYEEFDADIAPVEPTLVWVDTNEFLTLQNNVSVSTLSATFPIALATSTGGKTISLSSSTAPNGYLLSANGSGGVIFTPASTSGLTSVVGVSPISTAIDGGTVSVSLTGTYVNALIGTSPASVVTSSGTSTVSIDQAAITGATAATNAQVVRFYVKNTTGTTIPKGSAVYVSGATGDNALISLASATSDPSSSKTLGITAEAIATDAFGYVIEAGYLTEIDTSSTTAGAAVWLGNTPGSLVFVSPPAEPSHYVYLGVVVRVHAVNGSILVKVQNGYELDELHDVSAASPTDLDILQYKSSSSLWTKASIANAGIAPSVHTHDYVSSVIGTSPASVSTSSGTSTVSIIASSIDSSHLADNAIVAAKIAAGSVGTAKISSGAATSGQLLQANGLGNAIFATVPAGATVSISEFTASGTWTKPSGATAVYVLAVGAGAGGGSGKILATGTGEMGGKGGWGGSTAWRWIQASSLSSSVSVTIGAGGAGGAARTGSVVTEGLGGSAGGNTSFGEHVTASGGCITPITSVSELPVPSMRVAEFGSRTKYSSTDTTHTLTGNLKIDYNSPFFTADISPSASGAALFTAGAPGMSGPTNYSGRAGMDSATQTGGGGGGGSTNGSADAVNTGGAGGRGFGQTGTAASGGTAGNTGGLAGGNGSNATLLGSGGGGGGATVNGNAGSGGNGYLGGGGGGGGGVFRTSGTRTSGAGGTGGGGYLIVISI